MPEKLSDSLLPEHNLLVMDIFDEQKDLEGQISTYFTRWEKSINLSLPSAGVL